MMSDSKFFFSFHFVVLNCNVAIDLFSFSVVSFLPSFCAIKLFNRETVLFSQLQLNTANVGPAKKKGTQKL